MAGQNMYPSLFPRDADKKSICFSSLANLSFVFHRNQIERKNKGKKIQSCVFKFGTIKTAPPQQCPKPGVSKSFEGDIKYLAQCQKPE